MYTLSVNETQWISGGFDLTTTLAVGTGLLIWWAFIRNSDSALQPIITTYEVVTPVYHQGIYLGDQIDLYEKIDYVMK